MDDIYIAKSSNVETTMRFIDDSWVVFSTLVVKRSTDFKEWETAEISARSTSKNLDKAVIEVNIILEAQLAEVGNDIFKLVEKNE